MVLSQECISLDSQQRAAKTTYMHLMLIDIHAVSSATANCVAGEAVPEYEH
jgi:hypothetical protein